MPFPPTEVLLEGGWDEAEKPVVRAVCQDGLVLADDVMTAFDITTSMTRKAVIVGDNEACGESGYARDDHTFEIYLPEGPIQPAMVPQYKFHVATTAIHELSHCVRGEAGFDQYSLIEVVADEGVAYSNEGIAETTLPGFDRELYIPVFQLLAIDTDRYKKYLSQVVRDEEILMGYSARIDASGGEDREACNAQEELVSKWEKLTVPGQLDGNVMGTIGTMAVYNLIQQGAEPKDYIHMPAREILGI